MWAAILLVLTFCGLGSCYELPPGANDTLCSETPYLVLTDDEISQLGVTSMDQIVISRQRRDDANGLPGVCITTPANKYFHIDLKSCDPYIKQYNGLVCYTWVVRNQPFKDPSKKIVRFEDRCLNKTCCFNDTQKLGLDPITPLLSKIPYGPQGDEGSFQVELAFCSDPSCTNNIPPGSYVVMSNFIYAAVKMTNIPAGENRFTVQAKDCWATPTMYTGGTRYNVITSNCKANNPLDPPDAISIAKNFAPREAILRFRSFFWTSNDISMNQEIYLHCYVTICNSVISSDCDASGCVGTGRRRRDVEGRQMVSYGPIKIKEKKQITCSNGNGGCSDLCSMAGYDVTCSCWDGRYLGSDGKTCHEAKTELYFEDYDDGKEDDEGDLPRHPIREEQEEDDDNHFEDEDVTMYRVIPLLAFFIVVAFHVFSRRNHGDQRSTKENNDVKC